MPPAASRLANRPVSRRMHKEKCSRRLRLASSAPVFANGATTAAMSYAFGRMAARSGSAVTGAGGHGFDPDAVPDGEVLGSPEMDAAAAEVLSGIPSERNIETGAVVLRDGTVVGPAACSNNDCAFDVDLSQVEYVVHRHVRSDFPDSRVARQVTRLREMPGPGDHAFPVLAGAPNYFETPSGAFRVLEYSGGWQVRTISGTPLRSTSWHPRDSVYRRRPGR